MKGFVARDLNGSLWFHYIKPCRAKTLGKEYFWESDEKCFQIYEDDFPNFPELKKLRWQDAPIEVGFCIHKVTF